MSRKKRHNHHEEEEHIDETWLIPYADLLTLLLALFIVLFSMRSEDKSKMDAMIQSLYTAFNTISVFDTNSGGQSPSNTGLTTKQNTPGSIASQNSSANAKQILNQNKNQTESTDEQKLQEFMKQMQQYIDQNHLNAEIHLTDLQEGIQITLKDSIIFDSGSDQLKANFTPILDNIAKMLQTVDNSIIIEGHTDNQPIHSTQFISNWELSGARALSVVHYLQSKSINPQRMRYTGYGEYKPIYPNDTPAHREANRRVNIIVLRK
ncbi:OmpA family protein [Bacillus sp. BRMEA1]|uniref:OmpA family protein n=1 Tax=Neobacillus endophyticus TaxID=2738405 RepID=UPI0015679E7B|nr:OmpA family protein [Neobacillus endophyticus]NRD79369.1 OmpA family protein [Neobacillus endophyticus]